MTAIEILTGNEAGARDEHGEFPEGSVNFIIVEQQLVKYADLRQGFANKEAKDEAG